MAGGIRTLLSFGFQDDEFDRGLRKTEGRLGQHGRVVEKTFSGASRNARKSVKEIGDSVEKETSRMGRALDRLKGYFLGAFAFAAIARTSKELIGVNAQMERYHATLKAVLGSADAASRKLDFVRNFAATTPFQLPELVEATVRLEAYGIKAESVMQTVGDTAAAMGKDVMMVVEAIADAQTGEFERLKELGVKAVQDAGKTFLLYVDKQGKEQRAAVDRNNRAMITSTLQMIWNEKYEGAMRDLSRTWDGTWSNLADIASESAEQIGKGVFERAKADMAELLAEVNRMQRSGEWAELGSTIGAVFAQGYDTAKDLLVLLREYGPTLLRLVAVWATYRLAMRAAAAAHAAFTTTVIAWNALQKIYHAGLLLVNAAYFVMIGRLRSARVAMIGFNTVVRANPWGVIISLLATAGTAFLLFRQRTDEAADAQKRLAEETRSAAAAIREMDGAMLHMRRQQVGAQRSSLGQEIQNLKNLRKIMRGTEFKDEVIETGGMGGAPTVISGASTKQKALADLDQQIRDRQAQMNSILAEESEIENQINTDLDKRIAYLEAERNVLVATGEESARLKELNQEINALVEQRSKLQDAGVLSPAGEPADKALAEARELVAAWRQVRELAQADPNVRAHLEEVFRLSGEIAELEKQIAEVRGSDAEAGLQAILEERKAQQENARALIRQQEEFQRFVAALPNGGRISILPTDESVRTQAATLNRVLGTLKEYEQVMTRINNEREAGILTEEQFEEAARAAAEAASESLRSIYELLKEMGLLTPALEEAFNKAFEAIGEGAADAESGVEKLVGQLDNMAASLRAVSRFASVFGELDDNLRNVIDGTADVLDNLGRLVQLADAAGGLQKLFETSSGALSGIVPVVGMAAGVASMVKGIIDSFSRSTDEITAAQREQREEMRKLAEALQDNARRVSDSIREFTKAAVKGEGLTGTQRNGAAAAFGSFEDQLNQSVNAEAIWQEKIESLEKRLADQRAMLDYTGLPDSARQTIEEDITRTEAELGQLRKRGPSSEGMSPGIAFENLLGQLGNLGIDGFDPDSYRDLYDSLRASGKSEADAVQAIMDGTASGMEQGLRDMFENWMDVGEFGDNVAGAVESLRMFSQFLSDDLQQQFDHFISYLLDNVEGMSGELSALLQEAAGLDVSTPGGKARLNEITSQIAAGMAAGSFDLGGLTAEEVRTILEELQGFGQESATSGPGTSRSTQVSRTITEFQANELLAYQQELVHLEREAVQILRSISRSVGGSQAGVTSAPFQVEFPDTLEVTLPDNLVAAIEHVLLQQRPLIAHEVPMMYSSPTTSGGGTSVNVHVQGASLSQVMAEFELKLRKTRMFN